MAKVTVPYHLIADAGAEGDVEVWTVPSGRRFVVEKITVLFPAGVYGELHLYLKMGAEKAFPDTGDITGDNVLLVFETRQLVYESGSKLVIHYENDNTTETREAFIYVTGELL